MVKILAIDDDPYLREQTVEILRDAGYEVTEASNGETGLAAARQQLPDLILCDVSMPDLSGYEVLSTLRQEEAFRLTPFIFLTSKTDRDSLRQGMVGGANDYLLKPFRVEELLQAIRTQLERHQAIETRIAERLQRLRESIALALPHELKTPLQGILAPAELLAMELTDLERPDLVELATAISQSGQRLLGVVENVLLYTELELMGLAAAMGNQRLPLQEEGGHAAQAYDAAVAVATRYQRLDDLTVEVQPAALPLPAAKWYRALAEVLDNAFKYSTAGAPVTVHGQGEPDGFYVFQIRDRGCGLRPDQVTNIGAFVQFDRRWREQQGIGLGLAIAKRLVESYGGRFSLVSEVGVGTTVSLAVPGSEELGGAVLRFPPHSPRARNGAQ